MSLSLYEAALTDVASSRAPRVLMRNEDGGVQPLDVLRWHAVPDTADEQLLGRVVGPVLDIGCGPGRLGAALVGRGIPALGLDLSTVAVELARARGGRAVQGDVFGEVPGAGTWLDVLLIDGNVGIGGDPARLLRRASQLLAPQGVIHVEVGPPGGRSGSSRVRLEQPSGPTGQWFPWGWLSDHEVTEVAVNAGLSVRDRWHCGDRWFAELQA